MKKNEWLYAVEHEGACYSARRIDADSLEDTGVLQGKEKTQKETNTLALGILGPWPCKELEVREVPRWEIRLGT